MCKCLLTIAIPTYKRAEQLRRCLTALAPQLNEECWLHIADNASPQPASEIAEPILFNHQFSNYDLIRHPFNKGAHGNLFHCFETARSEWIWVLGDDDLPEVGAIDKILSKIRDDESVCAHVFDVNEFIGDSSHDCFGKISNTINYLKSNALYCSSLISSGVYNVLAVRSVYPVGYQYSSSFYPHVAWIISCLQSKNKKPLRFHDFSIVKFCNDGFRDECISPILKNLWYLSRMLPNFAEKRALMQSTFMQKFEPKIYQSIFNFDFILIILAVAYIHAEPAQSIVIHARRRIAEIIEFQTLKYLFPFVPLLALLRLYLACFIGASLRPFIKIAYKWKCGDAREYPTILDNRQVKGTP